MSLKGLAARGVPQQPKFVLILRIVILVLSLAILGICGYNLSLFGGYAGIVGYGGPGGFMIFITIKTMIILGAVLFLEFKYPRMYYRLLILIAYGLNIIFWLSGWAWCASIAALFLDLTRGGASEFGGSLAAAAGLGAVNWVLMIIVTIFFIRASIHDPEGSNFSNGQNAELGTFKYGSSQPYVPTQQQQQPAPVYGGGQYPPQQQQQPYGSPYPPPATQ